MKKIIGYIVACSFIVVLNGCDSPAVPSAHNDHSSTIQTFSEETGIYIVQADYPKLDYSEKINSMIKEEIDTEIDLFIEEAKSLELTKEEIEEKNYGKSGLWITYEIYRMDDMYLSIAFDSSIYNSGAAHPYSYTWVFNYDVQRDKELFLIDMFVPDTMFWEAISSVVVPKLNKKLYGDTTIEDEWIAEGAGPDPQHFHAFTITEDSFVFHFAPYEVAAYAAGPQRITVPFSELDAILMPEWAPTKR
ncbi:DUF3298 domain-containing protein [Candidatus Peregrinibacteria bacterium]|nr:DUF3298 domain-containing protein [Candidatus Peregrinibacteria bacterium]